MEFVPNEISPLVDVYPFAMNVEGGGNAVSRTCSRDSRGEYPVLGRDERVFRGMVFVKLSKIDFLPMFSLIFRQRFKISNCSSELGRNDGNGNYSSDKSFCIFKNCRVEENSLFKFSIIEENVKLSINFISLILYLFILFSRFHKSWRINSISY